MSNQTPLFQFFLDLGKAIVLVANVFRTLLLNIVHLAETSDVVMMQLLKYAWIDKNTI